MTLSIVVFFLVVFSFICGRLWGYLDGYAASIRDMKHSARDDALNRRKLSSQEA